MCSKGNSFLNSLSLCLSPSRCKCLLVASFGCGASVCVPVYGIAVHGSNDLIKRSLNGKNVVFLSFVECRRRFDVEWLIFSIQNPSNDVVLKCLLLASLCFIILFFAQILIVF